MGRHRHQCGPSHSEPQALAVLTGHMSWCMQIELAGLPSLGQKAARVAKLARILGSEALGTVAMAPYGGS